jgi:hypothetical protein
MSTDVLLYILLDSEFGFTYISAMILYSLLMVKVDLKAAWPLIAVADGGF